MNLILFPFVCWTAGSPLSFKILLYRQITKPGVELVLTLKVCVCRQIAAYLSFGLALPAGGGLMHLPMLHVRQTPSHPVVL